jgi:hypothetical protein
MAVNTPVAPAVTTPVQAEPNVVRQVPVSQIAPAVAPAVTLPQTGVEPVAPAAPAEPGNVPVVTNGSDQAVPAGNADTASSDTAPAAQPPAGDAPLTPSQRLAAKIEKLKARILKDSDDLTKLEAQYRAADMLDKIAAGSVIKARVGRAETAREVTASVIGVQTLDSGDRRLKVYFGEGFDAETVVIQDSQIIDVVQV